MKTGELVGVLLLAVFVLHVDCEVLYVNSRSDCKSIYLSSNEELDIHYSGGLTDKCEIKVDAYGIKNLCVEAKEFHISSCAMTVKYFENQYSSSFSDKSYSCGDSPSKWCPFYDGSIKIQINPPFRDASSVRIHLHVTQTDSNIDDTVKSIIVGVYAIIGIVIGVIVLIVIVVTIVVCCVCNRRRNTSGTVYRGQQPGVVATPGTYPTMATTTAYPYPQPGVYPQAGYQPPVAQGGYQPGYQPPPQDAGFQTAPGTDYKPASAPPTDMPMQPIQPPPYGEN